MKEKENEKESASTGTERIVMWAVEQYQCPGCICGSDIECYQKGNNLGCNKHVTGTIMPAIGKIFLGLPIGFSRIGPVEKMKICIFKRLSDGWGYDKFNVPAWKHKDKYGNVLVRGISPRINFPFLHIFLEDCMKDIDCLEITEDEISEMD